MTWIQLLERLQAEQHWGSFVFNRFVNWYAPFFTAYSFVMARIQEYEADRRAAEVAGPENAAEALINLEVKSKFLDRNFWPDIFKQADQRAEPPAAAFTTMSHTLRDAGLPDEAGKWIVEALAEKTTYDDTHPSLADRLTALGYTPSPAAGENSDDISPPLPPPHRETAAHHFLGDSVEKFIVRLDSFWKERIAPQWRERHEYARKSQIDLQKLEEKARSQPLTAEETWDRARWTAEFKGGEAAIPLLEEILAAEPDHAAANYVLGQILLEQNNDAGIRHLERAMERESDLLFIACELIYNFLKKQARPDEAEPYAERAREHYNALVEAEFERRSASALDTFEPHGLPSVDVESLLRQLSMYERVGEAYLARKVVTRLPEKPFYVLGIVTRHAWHETNTSRKDGELVQELVNLAFPGHFYVIVLNENQQKLKQVLQSVEGARIYSV